MSNWIYTRGFWFVEDRAVIFLTHRKADNKLSKIQNLFRLRKFVFTTEKQTCSIIDLKVPDGHVF